MLYSVSTNVFWILENFNVVSQKNILFVVCTPKFSDSLHIRLEVVLVKNSDRLLNENFNAAITFPNSFHLSRKTTWLIFSYICAHIK